MHHFPRYCVLCTALLATTVLASSLGPRLSNRADLWRSIDDWSILELADHLNRAGLQVRLRSTSKDGGIGQSVFLTTADKTWEELNHLSKAPSRLQEWRDTVHCMRGGEGDPVLWQWGDHCLVAGPFIFYGDAGLLERIAAILAPSVPPAPP